LGHFQWVNGREESSRGQFDIQFGQVFSGQKKRNLRDAMLRTQMKTYHTTTVFDSALPEFVDAKGARRSFGLSRSHLYELDSNGKIRSVCIRRSGAMRGRRLFDCDSIRNFLNSCEERRGGSGKGGAK